MMPRTLCSIAPFHHADAVRRQPGRRPPRASAALRLAPPPLQDPPSPPPPPGPGRLAWHRRPGRHHRPPGPSRTGGAGRTVRSRGAVWSVGPPRLIGKRRSDRGHWTRRSGRRGRPAGTAGASIRVRPAQPQRVMVALEHLTGGGGDVLQGAHGRPGWMGPPGENGAGDCQLLKRRAGHAHGRAVLSAAGRGPCPGPGCQIPRHAHRDPASPRASPGLAVSESGPCPVR